MRWRVPKSMSRATSSDNDWLDLADAIELLRLQVMEAQSRRPQAGVRFLLTEITLELEVELVRTGGGGGSLRFGVANVDARGERSSSRSHRVVVAMRPKSDDGGDVEVSDSDD